MKFKQFIRRLFCENILLKISMLAFALVLAIAVGAVPSEKSGSANGDGGQAVAEWVEAE